MNQPETIFTIECPVPMMLDGFVQILQHYGVNCVVDVRNVDGEGTLPQCLKANGIVWLPMYEEFGCVHEAMRMGKPRMRYDTVVKKEDFCHGIARLHDGMAKGYKIAVIDATGGLDSSFRFLMLGKKLYEDGVVVWHINGDGSVKLHSELIAKQESKRRRNADKAHRSAEIGKLGERIAADYLESKGFAIVDRNWNMPGCGEIDIVAQKCGVLHFVEVKTRSSEKYGMPHQAINYHKMRRLYSVVGKYLCEKRLYGITHVLDSISIVLRSAEDYDIEMFDDINCMQMRYY